MHTRSLVSFIHSWRVTFAVVALLVLIGGTATLAFQPSALVSLYLPTVYKPGTVQVNDKWVSAYYVGYQRDLLRADEIDWSTLSHLMVGRITPTATGGVTTNFDIDDVQGPQMARDLAQRAHAANRKAILMLGGAGEHDAFVSAASAQRRATFVSNLVAVMDDLGYDGIDVDWEPITASDRPLLLALLRELRAAKPGIILTIPVGWVNANFPDEVDSFYAEVAGLVDQMNIMSYDMAGNWGGWDSWHSGALRGESGTHPSSIDSTVRQYLKVGVPAAKLGIGIGFYGSCWRGVTAPRVPLDGRTVSMGNSDNTMSYTNIMRDYFKAGARTFDTDAQVPYLHSETGLGPQNCNFVSYEDAESIAAKGAYVQSDGLGGAIIWTIGQGHLPNAPAGSRDPLMQAAKEAFIER